jgi:ABC-type nitrate/sulfonate/bicarbonate transport system substrate-binding protein
MGVRATERFLNILIFLGALVLIFIVGYPQYKESLPTKIKIGVDKSYGSLPFYIAKMDTSRNYFTIEKIEPEFVDIKGDPLQGLRDKQYDIAAVPWYWLLISPAINGDTIRSFSSIELKSNKLMDAIIIPPKSRIKKIKDLEGKKLGYLASDEHLVNLIIPELTLDFGIKKLETVKLQLEEIATALVDKRVDVLYLIDPYRGYMLFQGNEVLFEGLINRYIVPNLPYVAFVMRENFVKSEDKLGAIRVKNAVEATCSYITRNPEVAKRYLVRINDWPIDGSLLLKIRVPEFQRLSEISVKSVENLQTKLVQNGIGTCGLKPTEFLFGKTDFAR